MRVQALGVSRPVRSFFESTFASAAMRRSVTSMLLISREKKSTGLLTLTAAWRAMPSAKAVLCVGIIDAPARYRWFGESTVMHLTGTEATGRIAVITRRDSQP